MIRISLFLYCLNLCIGLIKISSIVRYTFMDNYFDFIAIVVVIVGTVLEEILSDAITIEKSISFM